MPGFAGARSDRFPLMLVVAAWLLWAAMQWMLAAHWAAAAALLPLSATVWAVHAARREPLSFDAAMPVWRIQRDDDGSALVPFNARARQLTGSDATRLEANTARALGDGNLATVPITLTTADGRARHLELHPIAHAGGADTTWLYAGVDVTDRMAVAARMHRTQQLFDESLKTPGHVLYRIDARRAAYDYVSTALADRIEETVTLLCDTDGVRHVRQRIPASDRVHIDNALHDAHEAAHGRDFDLTVEYDLCASDGRICRMHDSMHVVLGDAGEIDHITGVIVDTTETHAAAKLVGHTLNAIGDALIATDANGRVTQFNPGAAALTGWPAEQAIGRSIHDLLRLHPQLTRAPIANPVDAALKDGRAVHIADPVSVQHRSGQPIPVTVSAAPIRLDKKKAVGVVVVMRDERAHYGSLERLHESEARYRTLVESSPVGIFHFDATLRITFLNMRFAEILEVAEDRLIGADIETFADHSVLPAIRAALAGELGRYEGPYQSAVDSEQLRITIRTAPVRDTANKVVGGVGIVEDDTAKYAAERKLRESEARYALAMRGTNEGLWDWNPITQELFLSARLMTLMDEPADAVRTTGEAWLLRVHPDDRPLYRERMVAHLKGASTHFELEARLATRSGEYRWFQSRGVAQRNEDGVAYRMVGSIGDITARKRAQMQLTNELAFSRTLVDSLPVGLCVTRRDGRLTLVNQHFARLTGFATRDLQSLSAVDLIVSDDRPVIAQRMDRAFEDGSAWAETMVVTRHGEQIPVHFLARRLTLYGMEQLLCIATDISERKRAEQKMRDLNRELEYRVEDRTAQLAAAVKELEAFSYSVSHDLRSPLRAIDGYARIIREDFQQAFTPDAHTMFERMLAAVSRMSDLIDDLLKLSQVTRRPLQRTTIDLSAMAEKVMAELRHQDARQAEITIDADMEVVADAKLLQIALENLLGNAWKFTGRREHAQIHFGSFIERDETVFFVEDNGAGFDMRYADKLFGAFQRLHSERDFDGTGIGLATVARIIQRHAGRVWARGTVDEGASFFFTLGDADA